MRVSLFCDVAQRISVVKVPTFPIFKSKKRLTLQDVHDRPSRNVGS